MLKYLGDSDAHIVRGLIAILLTLYSGHTPQQILATDAIAVFDEFGFREHLTPQRSNGLRAMVESNPRRCPRGACRRLLRVGLKKQSMKLGLTAKFDCPGLSRASTS